MNSRIIWLFKEYRSGSSWLCNYICKTLNINYLFVEGEYQHLKKSDRIINILNRTPVESDSKTLLHTHLFEGITSLKKYEDPIVLRCSRKDKFQQFLSWYAVKQSDWTFFHLVKDESVANHGESAQFRKLLEKRIVVPKSAYHDFIRSVIIPSNKYWSLVKNLTNETIYYEDMLRGDFSIHTLGLHNISMDENFYIKNPESYKNEIFINYEEVKSWFDNTGVVE